jgi:hypothetical protein
MIAGFVGALDQHARDRLGAGVEDTHAIIGELQPGDVALIFAEVLAQREVERIDRAVAFGGGDQKVVADLHLHHRHADGDAFALGVDALLDADVEFLHVEVARHLAEEPPGEQLERGVGRFVGIADGLALLDLVEQARQPRIVLVDGKADAVELGEQVRAAGLIGDEELALVADALRRERARRSPAPS